MLQASRDKLVQIHVLWRSEIPLLRSSYFQAAEKYPEVCFVEENEEEFGAQVRALLSEFASRSPDGCVMFAVDDAIFYRQLQFARVVMTLKKRPDLLCIQPKLSTSIHRCQPREFARMTQPELTTYEINELQLLVYEVGKGSLDWDYPWDLTCSVYRVSIACQVLEQVKLLGLSCTGPNELEAHGALALNLLMKQAEFPNKCAVFKGAQAMSVVTINRVQETYKTPVYESNTATDVDTLNSKIGQEEMDIPRYAQEKVFDTVHIGELFLTMKYTLSVLIPVRDAERYLSFALRSVMAQDLGEPYEIIIINDRSQDSTLEVAQRFIDTEGFPIRLVENRGTGVGAALNTGLAYCSGDFVARMDADDISAPSRFTKQIEHLRKHKKLFALGTAAYSFTEGEVGSVVDCWEVPKDGMKVIKLETESWKVEWESYFRCAVIHPTVVMDRAKLLLLGGYSETSKAEDYDLWLRALTRGYLIANLSGEPLLLLRKHHSNASKTSIDPRKLSIETGEPLCYATQ